MINMTIVDFLRERADRNANDLAFRFLGNGELDGPITEWTFSELYHQSAGVAEDLVEQGLTGTSVLLVFPPGLEFVKAFYGCLLAGARAVPVPLPNPRSKNPLGRIPAGPMSGPVPGPGWARWPICSLPPVPLAIPRGYPSAMLTPCQTFA